MTLFDVLQLRSEWEDIVKSYKFVPADGTIDNLTKFVATGHRGNRFREGFDRAMEIAINILEYYNEKSHLSGVYGKTLEPV